MDTKTIPLLAKPSPLQGPEAAEPIVKAPPCIQIYTGLNLSVFPIEEIALIKKIFLISEQER